MERLKSIVLDYIDRDKVDYAILIDGQWGSGKTFFWKHTLKQEIEDRGYKTVYVSLNGVNSLDEVSKKMFLGAYTIFSEESKAVGVASELGKVALSVASMFGYDLGKSKIDYKKFVNFKDYVLCFDDFERSKIDVEELLGYINTFVEHDNVKTIIIGNEEEIENLNSSRHLESKNQIANKLDEEQSNFTQGPYYLRIKEKLIGKTIRFEPDDSYYSQVLSEIIESYNTDSNYSAFLDKNKSHILKVFSSSSSKNLRILKHSLSDFYRIYNFFAKDLGKQVKPHVKDLVSRTLLIFAIAISFEFKLNNVTPKDIEAIEKGEPLSLMYFYLGATNSKKKNFLKEFSEKYNLIDKDCYYVKSIEEYILTGYFNEKLFAEECAYILQKYSEDKKDQTPLQQLGDYWVLSDEEFLEATKRVLAQVKNGEFQLMAYPRIFQKFEKFSKEGLIKENIDEIMQIFKEGIHKSYKCSEYDDFMSMQLPVQESVTEEYKEIKMLVNKLNNKLKDRMYLLEANRLQSLLQDDVDTFQSETLKLQDKNLVPLFKYFDPNILFERVIELDNKSIITFRDTILKIYNFSNIDEFFKEDYENLLSLKIKLEKYIKQNQMSLRIHLLKILVTDLETICSKLKNGSNID